MIDSSCVKELLEETEKSNENLKEIIKNLELALVKSPCRHKRFIENTILKLKANVKEREEVIDKINSLESFEDSFNEMLEILTKLQILDNSDRTIFQMFKAYVDEWKN